jgi:ribosome recycling factor
MVESMVSGAKPKMESALEHFLGEIKTVRTGRASVGMVEGVVAMYYGTPTPLKALATLTTPDASQILIQPFDANAVSDIVTAIRNANLGFNPTDDGRQVRVSLPPLTAERREELVKMVGKMAEETRITVRQIRGSAWDAVQKAQKEGVITEDNRDWGRDQLDKLTAEFNKKIEDAVKEKEAEIRTI